ncbi:MAG: ABC transporter permease [Pseudomonadota bacterium]
MPAGNTHFNNALVDLLNGINSRSVWLALGWNDVNNRYNRSKLGVFWASLSILIFVGALGPIYASLMSVETRVYMIHLLLGFIVWNFVSNIILECSKEFIGSAHYLTSFQLSYFTLLFRVVWRNTVVLCYQMLVFVILALFFRQPVAVEWAVVPLALLMIMLNALWIGLIMSILAARYRDFSELFNNIFRLVFFVTPIIWMPNANEQLNQIAQLNPFFHLIELFREPLLQGNISLVHWQITAAMAVSGWILAFALFARYRSRIAFWL